MNDVRAATCNSRCLFQNKRKYMGLNGLEDIFGCYISLRLKAIDLVLGEGTESTRKQPGDVAPMNRTFLSEQ